LHSQNWIAKIRYKNTNSCISRNSTEIATATRITEVLFVSVKHYKQTDKIRAEVPFFKVLAQPNSSRHRG
jgi:hypothetical protein